jgi:diacylglycerol kinase family enzyme
MGNATDSLPKSAETRETEAGLRSQAREVTCILNGAAGSKRAIQIKERLTELFSRHGAEARVLLARNGRELTALAYRAVEDRCGTVVAAGGDGTMNAVAGALAGTETPMGVLPLGTLNHFAKDLKLPLELEGAVATIMTGRIAHIDVGEVNGHVFLNNSSIGIYPWIVREREMEQRKGYRKWVAFARASVSVLKRYSLLHVRLRMEGQDEAEVETPFVFVGNNRYESQGFNIGQRNALNEGQLWVCRAPPASRSRLLVLAIKHMFGSARVSDLEIFDALDISVRTRASRLAVATDGEVILLEPPLRYRIRPGALRVIVPPETASPVANSCAD